MLNKPLSFTEHKTRLKSLEDDNLELLKALKETNINLQTVMFAYDCLLKKCRETMTDKEIDKLFVVKNVPQNS